jgi:8-oxo-dGTP pyrophosphatase MutT (NUDIX family)
MNELADRLTKAERVEDSPGKLRAVRPRDAATLILVDRSRAEPRVLVGRRHDRHVFMAGKFVFPGGRIDRSDARMNFVGSLDEASRRRLTHGLNQRARGKAHILALTALRETCEETGLLIGRRIDTVTACPAEWKSFATASVVPDLAMLKFVARAITPPGRPRRFDTRFFVADRGNVAATIEDPSGPDSELVELVWLPLSQAREHPNMPTISKVVLIEVEKRLQSGTDVPVPFYSYRSRRFHRAEIT